jgi:hypothetical protein
VLFPDESFRGKLKTKTLRETENCVTNIENDKSNISLCEKK